MEQQNERENRVVAALRKSNAAGKGVAFHVLTHNRSSELLRAGRNLGFFGSMPFLTF